MTALSPVGNTTATMIRQDQIIAYDEWEKLSPLLKGLGTRVVLIGPDGWLFNLAGPDAGRQGVRLAKQLQGEHNWPFELLLTEGAYQMGVTIERTNYKGRDISAGVTIGGSTPRHLSEFQYRWAEDRFMHQIQQDRNCWLGIYTRFSGWRWAEVRLKVTIDTPQTTDATAFGNNTATWDLQLLAPKPYYAKRMLFDTWFAAEARRNQNEVQRVALSAFTSGGTYTLAFNGSAPSAAIPWNATQNQLELALQALSTIGAGNVYVSGSFAAGYVIEFANAMAAKPWPQLVANDANLTNGDVEVTTVNEGKTGADTTTGTIVLANRGDLPAYPRGLIVGEGLCSIQDGLSDRMVPIGGKSGIKKTDGAFVALDTDPEEITLIAANDPVDNFFYQRIRASKLLDAFLHNIAAAGERIDFRMDTRFENPIPPGEVAHLRVHHENPNAEITLFMPQHYKRSR